MGERRDGALFTAAVLLVIGGFAFACTVVGAVEPWAQSVMGAAGVAALLAAALAGRLHPLPGGDPRRVRLLAPEIFALLLLALGVLQCVPLPVELHRTLSPEAGRLFDRGLPPGEGERWRTLSVHPWATRVEVLRLAALLAVFSLFARGIRRAAEARFAVGGFVALGAVAAAVGIADGATGGELLGWYPREDRSGDRLSGVLVNPNHFAGMMEMTALAALGLYFAFAAPEEEGEEGPEEAPGLRELLARGLQRGTNRGPAVLLLAVLLVATAALLLTASRLGAFGFLVGLGTFALLLSRSRRSGRVLLVLAGVTGALLAVNAVLAADPVLSRWSLFFGGDRSAEGRVEAWRAVAAMGARFPVTGSGLGTFGHIFPAYQPEGLWGTWDHAHNDFLQLFTDGGGGGDPLRARVPRHLDRGGGPGGPLGALAAARDRRGMRRRGGGPPRPRDGGLQLPDPRQRLVPRGPDGGGGGATETVEPQETETPEPQKTETPDPTDAGEVTETPGP